MPSKTPKQAKEFVSADKVGAKHQFKNMPKVNQQETKHGKLDLPRFKKRGVK